MKPREKIAITVDPELLAEVERRRAKSGESRSAVFERALVAYLGADERRAQVERHADGYRRLPETEAEQSEALATAQHAFAANPWDAPR